MDWGDGTIEGIGPVTTVSAGDIDVDYAGRHIGLQVDETGPSLSMSVYAGGLMSLLIQTPTSMTIADMQGRSLIQLETNPDGDGPSISLDVGDATRAVLGAMRLTTPATGSTEIRPPGSMVFLDQEGNVLWRAP